MEDDEIGKVKQNNSDELFTFYFSSVPSLIETNAFRSWLHVHGKAI